MLSELWGGALIMVATIDLTAAMVRRKDAKSREAKSREILALKERISVLAAKGKQVVAERDRLEAEIARLTEEQRNLRERLSTLVAKGKRVVADRDRWETQAIRLSIELTEGRAELKRVSLEKQSDEKFVAAKRAFARLFHPNKGGHEGLEKLVRAEIFKSFWPILEGIDQGEPTTD
jgi:FtsZ-binding cell division protein ZapB